MTMTEEERRDALLSGKLDALGHTLSLLLAIRFHALTEAQVEDASALLADPLPQLSEIEEARLPEAVRLRRGQRASVVDEILTEAKRLRDGFQG
jgi:hypothetical protein